MSQGFARSSAASDHTHVDNEVPTGAKPGTSFSLANTPLSGSLRLYHERVLLIQVGASPSIGEYTISGSAITTGFTVQAGEDLRAWYRI